MKTRAKLFSAAFGIVLATGASASNCVQPVTCSDNVCQNAGPVVCSGPQYNFLSAMIDSGGDPYYIPNGLNQDGAIELQPQLSRMNCLLYKYANPGPSPSWTTNIVNVYGWHSASDPDNIVVTATNVPPPGFAYEDYGVSDPNNMTTIIYQAGLNGGDKGFNYRVPSNPGISIPHAIVPDPMQWQLLVTAHEDAHQNLDPLDEEIADGYGVQALDAYNAAGGTCP